VIIIISVIQSGKCNKAANTYRDELLELNNLELAIEAAGKLASADEKAKANKDIFDMLLARCGG
jgi:hypothetical protein